VAQLTHTFQKIAVRCSNQKMIVIAHSAVGSRRDIPSWKPHTLRRKLTKRRGGHRQIQKSSHADFRETSHGTMRRQIPIAAVWPFLGNFRGFNWV
jgi:hypothetical protein